jgi:hypothetical protein
MTDPTMPRLMPPAVERALRVKFGWRDRPGPIDLYNAIRDALVEDEPDRPQAGLSDTD